jgi:hypothetical protein
MSITRTYAIILREPTDLERAVHNAGQYLDNPEDWRKPAPRGVAPWFQIVRTEADCLPYSVAMRRGRLAEHDGELCRVLSVRNSG